MSAPRTIVITLPKPLPPGAQVKGIITPESVNGFMARKLSSPLVSTRNIIQVVKEEQQEPVVMDFNIYEDEKPARKRQKLDHLSFDEKLMRRKLKNRVAAQTARDRKKIRMDELEIQVSKLSEKVSTLSAVVETLSQHNTQLEGERELLQNRISQCTCKCINSKSGTSVRDNKVGEERKTPVCSTVVESAEGNRTSGSIQSLISSTTLLPDRISTRLCQAVVNGSSGEKYTTSKTSSPGVIRLSLKRRASQMDGTSPASVDAHSVTLTGTSPFTPEVSKNTLSLSTQTVQLTAEEEDMIREFTIALEDSVGTRSQSNTADSPMMSFDNVPLSCTVSSNATPSTPELLLDLLDFEKAAAAQLAPIDDDLFDFLPASNPSSPITKEEILDFLKDSSKDASGSQTGSESGYDSALSPVSYSSNTSEDFYLEGDEYFSELFPSLIQY